jgi:transposase
MKNVLKTAVQNSTENAMQTVNVLAPSAAMPAGTVPAAAASATGKLRPRQQYSLAEKLSIVRESQQPGVSQAHVSRKYNLGKNVLWSWRRALSGFSLEAAGLTSGTGDEELMNLRVKIAELERLLGQKSFEIELLRNRLQGR